jgi:hypothetical protein
MYSKEVWAIRMMNWNNELVSTNQMGNLLHKKQQISTATPIRNSSLGQSTSDQRRRLPNHHMFLHCLPRSPLRTYYSLDLDPRTIILNLQHSSTCLYPTGDYNKSVLAMEMIQSYCQPRTNVYVTYLKELQATFY